MTRIFIAILAVTMVFITQAAPVAKHSFLDIRLALAQKLMLDVRYYCAEDELQYVNNQQLCKKPLTQLPEELAFMIRETGLGGIILFADNIQSNQQVLELNYQLQQAASKSIHKIPLFISIDQEGGRVARLPRHSSTSFSGNMAIGATYDKHGNFYAEQSGKIIADELLALGFNLNFAPNVDVNVNPENPVINVRSYGENADRVAELGYANMSAMQAQGMLATLKHFPGHGDTSVDSHTGLPRVDHPLARIKAVDLKPFQYAIDKGGVDMIMTAHIQYPALDNETFMAKSGDTMIKPATMSRKILTDILRNQMGFQGVVITDALEMAGISQFFQPTQAVIETFKAGADIALMPIKIRSKADIKRLTHLIDALAQAVANQELSKIEILASAEKILDLKEKYNIQHWANQSLAKLTASANKTLASVNAKQLEQALADHAITLVKGQALLPLKQNNWHVVMPDESKCQAYIHAAVNFAQQADVSCSSILTQSVASIKEKVASANTVIFASITPNQSVVERGGMDDLVDIKLANRTKKEQDLLLKGLMQLAKSTAKKTVFVSLRAPYEMLDYQHDSDIMIATYAYNTFQVNNKDKKQVAGMSYQSLVRLLTGKITAQGQLPVTVF